MDAKRDQKRRGELLSGFVDYLLQKGVSDLSLRPAAAALGTSARMLLYYFGSREQLLVDAMIEIRARERARFAEEIGRHGAGGSIADTLRASWHWYASESREPFLRLLFELYGLAFVNPDRFRGFLDMMSEDYFSMLEDGLQALGLSRRQSRISATLYRATFRGLLIDLLSTGDRARIDEAIDAMAASFQREVEGAASAGGRAAEDSAADPDEPR